MAKKVTTVSGPIPGWMTKIASVFAGGVVESVGPVLKDQNDRIKVLEEGPTDLAPLQAQLSGEIKDGLDKYLK